MRILHVITGLGTGGAEAMLHKLLGATAGTVETRVLSLMEGGSNAARIETLGVRVDSIGMARGRIPGPQALRRLKSMANGFQPDLIQGWMYHGNLAAWLAARQCARRPRLFWNIRQTLYDIRREAMLTRWLIRLGARLSQGVDTLIYNSEVSARQHEVAGFAGDRRLVIPNGFDTEAFSPPPEARAAVRDELGLGRETLVIGHVARYHPMKGHHAVLHAAAAILARHPGARFLLVGHGVTSANPVLEEQMRSLALHGKVILAGERSDVARLMAAMDVVVSASEWGEGFPNVLGEAMSAGISCVSTDVGDSAHVIGDCGKLVGVGDPGILAGAIEDLLELTPEQRLALGVRARDRIRSCFSMDRIAARYLEAYQAETS